MKSQTIANTFTSLSSLFVINTIIMIGWVADSREQLGWIEITKYFFFLYPVQSLMSTVEFSYLYRKYTLLTGQDSDALIESPYDKRDSYVYHDMITMSISGFIWLCSMLANMNGWFTNRRNNTKGVSSLKIGDS